jgi:pimeloyl-ACP methyl ester carboxylesterase
MVAAWIHDPATAKSIYGGDEGVAKRIADARSAVAAEATGQPTRTVPACSETDESAAMYGPFDYYLNPARGAIREWANRFAVRSWEPWLTFDALSAAKRLTVPTLFVHGDGCALPHNIRAVEAAMGEQATTLWISGSHLDFYDQPEQVDAASSAALSHFRRTLGATEKAR